MSTHRLRLRIEYRPFLARCQIWPVSCPSSTEFIGLELSSVTSTCVGSSLAQAHSEIGPVRAYHLHLHSQWRPQPHTLVTLVDCGASLQGIGRNRGQSVTYLELIRMIWWYSLRHIGLKFEVLGFVNCRGSIATFVLMFGLREYQEGCQLVSRFASDRSLKLPNHHVLANRENIHVSWVY
ncbi:hypothetical protein M404DRAFT_903828 [Pisolithus tinctorius Marx 270]|uniref:Uncharacterized protein n=1 Tax=Pisolithus tinctorius Marx 270 TaxID=870435 RepID=A0A0C3JMH0_PISTI|nr:hypothetical protein M404DRAFT_903828 [Pisolithus tinctorius Marx 270]